MTTPAPYPAFDGTHACADADPELFFPRTGHTPAQLRQATDVCSGCNFQRPCLAYALTRDVFGVWGGTTRATRDEIRRKHGIRAASMELDINPDFPAEGTPA